MTTILQVREALAEIVDPCSAATGSNLDIVSMGLVKSIDITDGTVLVEMRLTTPMCHMVPYFGEEVRNRVGELPGVHTVEFETDHGFEWTEDMLSDEAKRRRQAVLNAQRARYATDTELELPATREGSHTPPT